MRLKAWAEFFRIHTVALTGSVCVLGYVIGGGVLLSWSALLWFLFGLFFHACGFSHNNICDFRVDADDPAKRHFPLVAGKISFFWASEVNRVGMVFLMLFGAFLTGLRPVSTFFLVVVVVSGFLYNYMSKVSVLAPIPIALCFGLLAGVPYFSISDEVSPLILATLGFGLAQIWTQIAVLGYYKDMESDKVSLLKILGAKLVGERLKLYVASRKSVGFSWVSKLPMVALGLAVWFLADSDVASLAVLVLFTTSTLMVFHNIVKTKVWNHDEALRNCALCEILTYWSVVVALQGVLSWFGVLVMTVAPLAWFLLWNRLYWKTWRIGPKV